MRRLLTIALSVTFATTAFADETHEGEHDFETEHSMGQPALVESAARTIEVSMVETEDGRMVFEPGLIEVQPGETVRFAISNDGLIEHEFVFDAPAEIIAHKDEMMMDAAMTWRTTQTTRSPFSRAGTENWHGHLRMSECSNSHA